ncbi:insecticidal delta-endotoxin Cry8Ea1 family protein [Bacillus thuringiensis]|uniref:insecticidal delta-endotoxin Cry8Ea1 family protein n=1 Tax=Bacillus thuringiensis TaxID=1428 RepID=UPI0036EDAA6F
MNQNNQNEMQTIDSSSNDFSQSNRYPRYPLAKESNYKDWLASCDESNVDILSATSDVKGSVSRVLGIVNQILGFLGLGFIGTGLGVLGDLFNSFWPSNDNSVWEAFLRSVEELIDERIREIERSRIVAQFTGLRSVMSNYNGALQDWDTNRNNPALREEIRGRFANADDIFANRMDEFSIEGFEIQSLAVYAQAANLHLLLLRDGVLNGLLWGFDVVTVNRLYNRLVEKSGKYTDHCTSFYRQGLQELRNRGNWNAFNTYRRNMTIQVLDVISLFSNYDPRIYENNTNTQLTREIYTEPLAVPGWLNSHSNPTQFQQIENDLIRSPSVFSNLQVLFMEAGFAFHDIQTPRQTVLRTLTQSLNTGRTGIIVTPWQGALNPSVSQRLQVQFENRNVFNIDSVVARQISNPNSSLFGVQQAIFNFVYEGGNAASTTQFNLPSARYLTSITSNIPGTNSTTPTASDYTHRLSSITSTSVGTWQRDRTNIMAYGWTHVSAGRTNRIIPNRITQIPAVKSQSLITVAPPGQLQTQVVRGPGHTGGNLIAMGIGTSLFQMTITSSVRQRYSVRLRYVNLASHPCQIRIPSLGVDVSFTLPPTTNSFSENPPYSSFGYVDVPMSFETPNGENTWVLELVTTHASSAFDRVEFIPVNSTALDYEGERSLEKAKKAVDNLFTNTGNNALKVDTTDYDVDQAANLVECVPEELYTKEKMILLDEVKHAKQLSASRNLIQNGNFAFYTDEWMTSNNVSIQTDNQIFKGNYLKMPGARETEGGTTRFPTYVLQKIDESKLKPYTRYKVRGFVGSSHDVKLIVERYGKEVDAILNVRNDLALDTMSPSCVEVNQCQSPMYPIMHYGYLANVIDTNSYEEAQSDHADLKKEHGMCHQSHQFDFHIDTGEVYINKNPGIWVLFKISSPEGHATLDNMELIEDGPLVGESLALVKKREKNWQHEMETRWLQTKEVYKKAKEEIDALFTDAQDQALKFDTNISHIISAEHLVQSIPYVYNKWLSDVPGMNYDIYTELERRITQAYSLYERRNIIRNGNFNHDLNHWYATPHAKVQQIDSTAVLVLPNWGSNVSQNLCVEHNRGYILRVTAKKEDMGKGYVTISDCNGNQETLTFTSCANYVSNEMTNDQSEFHFSQEMNEQSSYNPNETINEQRNYVTRTIDFFPDTDQIRIDIGETEGTFKVESIELICMRSQ